MIKFVNQQKNQELVDAACAIVKLINNQEFDKQAAIELEESVFNAEISKRHLEYVKSFPELTVLIEELYPGPTIDIDALLDLPSNSFGYLFASSVKNWGIDVESFNRNRSNSAISDKEISYLRWLMRKTHDIWHLVTGFDLTLSGELGLKGFELAQYHSPLSFFSLVIVLSKAINDPKQMNSAIEKFIQGYQMGSKSKLLLAEKWEERWEQTLDEVRLELNIEF